MGKELGMGFPAMSTVHRQVCCRRNKYKAAFTPRFINEEHCLARTWSCGFGGQCHKKRYSKSFFCPSHSSKVSRPHGRVDGPIPQAKRVEFEHVARRYTHHGKETLQAEGKKTKKRKQLR